MITLSNHYPVARKEHICNFCLNKIAPGEKYRKQVNIYDDRLYTWKSHLTCEALCDKLKMFDHCDEGVTNDDFYEYINQEYLNITDDPGKKTWDEKLEIVKFHHLSIGEYKHFALGYLTARYLILNNGVEKDLRNKLSFEEWYNLNESEINIEIAETGADREMDFDSEAEFEKRYEKYLNE